MNRTGNVQRLLSLLLAYAFGTHFFLGSISVLNALGISYVFYFPREIRITVVNPQIDLWAWIFSVILLSVLLIWDSRGKRTLVLRAGFGSLAVALAILLPFLPESGLVFLLFAVASLEFLLLLMFREFSFGDTSSLLLLRIAIILLAYFAVIEIASGMHYVVRSFDVNTQVGRVDAGIEQQLSYSTYSLIPWLYAGFLFSWLWVPLVRRIIARNQAKPATDSVAVSGSETTGESTWKQRLVEFLNPATVLVVAVALFVGYYPYFQNPPWLVGTDAYWRYFGPLTQMNSRGLSGFLQALKERHPVPLALMYAAQLVFHSTAFEAVKVAPSFLVVGLGLSTWWFLGKGKNLNFGLAAFLFSVLSVSTTVGIFASILANWMALIVWVVFFAYCGARSDKKLRILDVFVLLVLSTLILFLHPWTWGVFAVSVALVGIVTLISDRRRGLRLGGSLILVLVADAVLALLSITLLSGSEGWRVADSLDLSTRWIRDPGSLLVFWETLTKLTEVWSPFFSALYLALSILGVFALFGAGLSPTRRRLILSWIFVSAVGSVLVSPIGFASRSESQLWRILFLTPFQLAAPLGAVYLTGLPKRIRAAGLSDHGVVSGTSRFRWSWLAFLLVIGVMLAWFPSIRGLIVLLLVPLATIFLLYKAGEEERAFLSSIILLILLLVVFSSATRGLAQLLLSPHVYR